VPILVDGNNLLHRLPSGRRSRSEVRRLSLDLARREGVRITVVFDGPPPSGSPGRESLGNVSIVYSDAVSADDAIIRRVPPPPRAADWVVVSDDRELVRRARRAGAPTRSLRQWLAKLEAPQRRTDDRRGLSPDEIAEWESFFAQRPPED